MIKSLIKIFTISFAILIFVGCDDYEFPKSSFPRVETLKVTDILNDGATLNGNLAHVGNSTIIDHGFVWGDDDGVTLYENEGSLMLGSSLSIGNFQGEILSGLNKDKTYYVRAIVVTESHYVYGLPVEFISK